MPSPSPSPSRRDGWRLLGRSIKKHRGWTTVGVVAGLVWTAAKVTIPSLSQRAIDQGIVQAKDGALLKWSLLIVMVGVISALTVGLRRYSAFGVAYKTETELRHRLFAHLQRLHFAFHDHAQTGQLMSRAATDLQQIQGFVVLIPVTVCNALTVIAVSIILFTINPGLALLALGALPFLNVFARRFSGRIHPVSMELQQELAGVATVVEETVTGIRVVKGSGAEELQARRLRDRTDRVFDRAMNAARIRAAFMPTLDFLPALGLLAVLWYGGHQVLNGHLSLGELTAFNSYIVMLIWPLRMTGMLIAQAQRAVAAAQRIQEILSTEVAIVDHPNARPLPMGRGDLRFNGVSFGYMPAAAHPVLDDFSLRLKPGEAVALVGPTGCGKTTVARLIPRFYDVNAGSIMLDGVDVRELRVNDLRHAVGIVFEDTFLFNDTVRANIAFADPNTSQERVEEAAQLAGAHDFIEQLPEGYDTNLGERGFSLSGGQRQRIALARAIVADPRVLILDDATSSVDPTKEHEIREALATVMEGRTTLVIAHRPATIALADRVAFIDEGRVVAEGTHEELLATNERYRQVLAQAESAESAGMRGGGGGPWSGHAVSEDERIDRREAGQVMRRAFRMLRPYRAEVTLALLVMVGFTAASVGGPAFIRYGVDHGLRPGHRDSGALNVAAIGYAAVALTALVLSRTQILLVTRVGEKFLRDLRTRVFDHILRMSMSFFDKEQTGRLVARMTSDIDSLQELIQMGLVAFATNFLLLIFTITLMLLLSPAMSAICLIALPIVILASIKFQRSSNRAYLKVRDRIGQTLSTFQEGISGVRVIQAFAREDVQVKRFSRANRAQLDANVHAVKISALYFPVIELAGIATTAAIIGIGGALYHGGRVSEGTIIAFVLLLANLFEPVQQLSQLFNMVQSSAAALSKLFGLLDTPSPLAERPGAVDLPMTGALDARDIDFAYDGHTYVLRDVSLSVAPGERLALVGPTGAGKSTLAKLLARLYDPSDGSITYGGVDLRDSTMRSLRERIVVVPQEGYLFQGSIRDNVRIGRPSASDVEVAEALQLIGAYDRFASLPEGLETEVRERGSRLSAGERQLVSLARAALANPQVLVLDEATSNLDPGTEADVELAMTALMEGRTSLVIAHRLSTAERADRVAVVDAGGLLELGTHDELVGAGGRYAALYESWAGQSDQVA